MASTVFSAENKYYEKLGLEKTASLEDIKKAYRKLALTYHPDKAPEEKKEEYTERFKKIAEAYSVLSDADEKAGYDRFLKQPSTYSNFSSSGFSSPFAHPNFTRSYSSRTDPFASFFNSYFQSQYSGSRSSSSYGGGSSPSLTPEEQRMNRLFLSEQSKEELRELHRQFLRNKDYLKARGFLADTSVIHLLKVYSDVTLEHLHPSYLNNKDIVHARLSHDRTLSEMLLVSKVIINQLLNERYSNLSIALEKAVDFFVSYTQYDSEMVLKAMHLNINHLKAIKPEKVLEFLQEESFVKSLKRLKVLGLYNEYSISISDGHTVMRLHNDFMKNVDILLVLYQKVNSQLLNSLYPMGSVHQTLVNRLISKHPSEVCLIDILGLLDQKSLKFEYDTVGETLKLSGHVKGQTQQLTTSIRLLDKYPSDSENFLIHTLAWRLDPEIFCKMIAAIPPKKRSYYLFSYEFECPVSSRSPSYSYYDSFFSYNVKYTAYEIFKYHIDELGKAITNSYSKMMEMKAKFIQCLNELINPVSPELKDDFANIKKQVVAEIRNYTAWWKMSIFGHHHEGRARHVLGMLEKAKTLDEMILIIDNQLDLLENKANQPEFKAKFEQFAQKEVFKNTHINHKTQNRWYNSAPVNLPNQANLKSSGYYRALLAAREILEGSREKAAAPSI